MTQIYITIVNQSKDFPARHIDGESGKVYTFKWNSTHPQGGCYTYEPKSQAEIDDIMRSQALYEIVFFSVWVPGVFDQPKPVKAEKPKEPEPPKATEPNPEAKSDEDSEEYSEEYSEDDKSFDWTAAPEDIEAQVKEIEDKDELADLIERHGGQSPAKQSKLETFQVAARKAILDSRIGKNEAPEPSELDI